MYKLINKIFFIICLLSAQLGFAQLTASVNSRNITENDMLTLTIKADNIDKDELVLLPLEKDFTITSNGKQYYQAVVNGQVTKNTIWEIGLSPKKLGELYIPALELNNQKTTPIKITVSKDNPEKIDSNKHIFIQTDLQPQAVYENQQAIFTVKIYVASNIETKQLNLFPTESDNLKIFVLADKQSHKDIDGKSYDIVSRSYAVFPQKTGKLDITGFKVTGGIADLKKASNNSFFNMLSYKPIQLKAPSKELTVKPKPVDIQMKYWLPAVKITATQDFNLAENLKKGDVITRTIKISAVGLAANNLPNPSDLLKNIANAKVYPDKAKYDNQIKNGELIGSVEQTISYIINDAGNINLPGLSLPWWNTGKNISATVSLPGKKIIAANIQEPENNTVAQEPTVAPQPAPAMKIEKNKANYNNIYLIIIIVLIIFCFCFFILWLNSKKTPRNKAQKSKNLNPAQILKQYFKNLKKSCEQNNIAHSGHNLFLIQDYIADLPQFANMRDIIAKYKKELECMQYAQDEQLFDGKEFYARLQQDIGSLANKEDGDPLVHL
jgi:hypothetical protein